MTIIKYPILDMYVVIEINVLKLLNPFFQVIQFL